MPEIGPTHSKRPGPRSALQFDDGQAQGYQAQNRSLFDVVGGTSRLHFLVFRTRSGAPSAARSLAGKRTVSPAAGWEWQLTNAGKVAFFLGSSSLQLGATGTYSDDAYHVLYWQCRDDTGEFRIGSELGQTGLTAVSGNCSSTANAGLGYQRIATGDLDKVLYAEVQGTQTEGVDPQAKCQALHAHLVV